MWGKTMNRLAFIAVAVGATLASATVASAATIIGATGTFGASAPTSAAITVNRFNSSLGTLNSVTLDFTSTLLEVSGTVRNNSNGNDVYDFTTGVTASITGLGFNSSNTLAYSTGIDNLPIPGKGTVNIGPYSGTATSSQTLSTGLAAFLGSGTTTLNYLSKSLFAVNPESGKISISPQISGAYTLTYNYTAAATSAVPEPATWGMMLLGFGMIGFAARHRRRQKIQVKFA
jgi:hypothetical protein